MKKIIIAEQFVKEIDKELEAKLNRTEGKSDDYYEGFTDAIDIILDHLRDNL